MAAVRAGETVRVTFRGKPVAEIRPLPTRALSKLDQLIAEGRATPGDGKKLEPIEPFPVKPGLPSGTEMILADREDERP